jgi:hypothetical protein
MSFKHPWFVEVLRAVCEKYMNYKWYHCCQRNISQFLQNYWKYCMWWVSHYDINNISYENLLKLLQQCEWVGNTCDWTLTGVPSSPHFMLAILISRLWPGETRRLTAGQAVSCVFQKPPVLVIIETCDYVENNFYLAHNVVAHLDTCECEMWNFCLKFLNCFLVTTFWCNLIFQR